MTYQRAKQLVAAASAVAIAGVAAVPQAAEAAAGATLYVSNMTRSCTDSGTGTQAAPYCSIQAAANAAVPGDVVVVAGNDYLRYAATTISTSGTAAAPITFEVAGAPYFRVAGLTITGSHVDVVGAYVESGSAAVTVDGSDVTLDHGQFYPVGGNAVVAGPKVSGLVIERSQLWDLDADTPLVQLGAGDTDTVIAEDIFNGGSWVISPATSFASAIALTGDSGTEITGNTVYNYCGTGVSVSKSTGTSIENNLVGAMNGCKISGQPALSVDASSTSSTTEGYNIISTGNGYTPYSWGGKTYPTQAAFSAASGQGKADDIDAGFLVDPGMTDAVGSANPSAPGELSTDFYGNAWSGTPDRGAILSTAAPTATLYALTFAPQSAQISLSLRGSDTTGGDYTVDWGDGTALDTIPIGADTVDDADLGADHNYAAHGTYTVTVTLQGTTVGGTLDTTQTATISTDGSTYVPVTPTRVLDTRAGTGAAKAPISPHGTVAVDVSAGVTLPAGIGTIAAAVLNVTATDETANGVITAYPDGATLPKSSNVNFGAHTNIANLVTVMVGADGKVDFNNGSAATTDLIADVEGYYVDSAAGSYYLPNKPDRVLDTRYGTGGSTGPVPAHGQVSLSVPNCVSGSTSAPATAVALNVTAVAPSANGVVTVYPDQGTVPVASNLNYGTGQNTPNLVVVKVGADGKIDLYNGSAGTVQLVADLEGCYSTSLGDAFVPVVPYRSLDTRNGLGQPQFNTGPVGADGIAQWYAGSVDPYAGLDFQGVAEVMNVTVTQPQSSGYVTAYGPYGTTPPTASNLNFHAGETVPNLVMVGSNPALYNGSKGTTQLIVDMFGYFA